MNISTKKSALILSVILTTSLIAPSVLAKAYITIKNQCGKDQDDKVAVVLASDFGDNCKGTEAIYQIPHESKKTIQVSTFCTYNVKITYFNSTHCKDSCKFQIPHQLPGVWLTIKRDPNNYNKCTYITRTESD